MATTRSQGILVAALLASGFAVAPAPCQTDEGTIDQSQVASEAGRCYAAEDPESCFSQWLDDDPSAVVYSLRAYHRFKLNHFREAESDLTAAISMDPTNPSYLNGRADVREKLGLNAQAEKDREAARDLIRRGYPELRRLDLRLAENPNDLDALYERSLELERRGDLVGALRDAESYARLKNGTVSHRVLYRLSLLRRSNGDSEGAIHALDQAIAHDDIDDGSAVRALRQRAALKRQIGDEEGAKQDEARVDEIRRALESE